MNFDFSEDQNAIRELAAQIFGDRVSDDLLKALPTSDAPRDDALWSSLGEANLLGLLLPEDCDGMALGMLDLIGVLEEQGRFLAPVPLIATMVLGAWPVARFGSEEQRGRLLAGVAGGDAHLTAAFHEVGGRHAGDCATTAKRDDDSWLLDGEKVCISGAAGARRVLVPGRTPEGVALFLVDPEADGASLEAQRATNHEIQHRLTLRGARVPAQDVLADAGQAPEALRWTLERGNVAFAALMLGVGAEALRRTADYVSNRKQFGRPIGTFQGVALRAADGYIDAEAMRSTLWQAAWRLDEGLDAAREVAVAKWWACRGGQRIVHTAQHLHAGIGSDVDYPIHRYFLWAKEAEIQLGGAGQQLARLGELIAAGEV